MILDQAPKPELNLFWEKNHGNLTPMLSKDYSRLISQLEFMRDTCATTDLLRKEWAFGGKAWAVPSKDDKKYNSHWRLYCMHVSDFLLVLFNGGIKIGGNPMKCVNVRQHFCNANALTIAIQSAINNGSIKVDDHKLLFDPDQKFEYKKLP